MSVSACVCVCLFLRISLKPHFRTTPNFLCMLPVDVAQSSFGCLAALRYAMFCVLWLTLCFHIMAKATQKGMYSKRFPRNDLYCVEWGVELYSNQPTSRGHHGFDTAMLQLQLQSFTLKQLFSEESCGVVGLSEKMSFQLRSELSATVER